MLITKEVVKEIGYQIEPREMSMNAEERMTFQSIIGELSQKELLAELAKTDCEQLDALVRLYTSNTLNNTQQKEIYQKILDMT